MARRPYVQAWPVWCPTHRFGMVRILPSTSLPESPGWVKHFHSHAASQQEFHKVLTLARFSLLFSSMIFLLQSQLQHHCMQTMHYYTQSFHLLDLMLAIAFSKMESCLLPRGPQAGKAVSAPPKTVVMQIGTTCAATTANEFTLENQLVESVPNHKHLGLVISSDLTWDEHLKGIMSRASQRIGLLKQMSRYLPPNTTAKLYLYYVRPCFEYASPVWHGATPASAAQSLERLQASMARTILRAEWTTPKKELLAALQWPSLQWRRAIASLTRFHSPEKLTNSSCVFVSPRSIC